MKIEKKIKKNRNIRLRKTQKNSYFLMSVASLYTQCFVMFCVFLYGPFCHGAHKLDLSTLFTTFFLWTSLPFILCVGSRHLTGTQDYVMRCRGEIEVKGKGKLTTYFLLGKKPMSWTWSQMMITRCYLLFLKTGRMITVITVQAVKKWEANALVPLAESYKPEFKTFFSYFIK